MISLVTIRQYVEDSRRMADNPECSDEFRAGWEA